MSHTENRIRQGTESEAIASSKRWLVAPPMPQTLRDKLPEISPILLQILFNRGLTDKGSIHAFLEGQYLKPKDPYLLPDMELAVARIIQAIENNENIVVYGDFDADGVTSTVLLVEALRGLGCGRKQTRPYIPDRVDEGYGLNIDALSKIKHEYKASLVITVDCGIRSVAEVAHANEIGLDVIITDHHSLGPQMPPALAVINPKRDDSAYPEKMLAGVGIAYKLAEALSHARPTAELDLAHLLDLVAIGTVADVAPLQGENRSLVKEGLTIINSLRRPGISALAKVAGLRAGQITAESIGFALGPRINAAGRLEHAYDAARLLATDNLLMAGQMAERLNELNRQRQSLTSRLNSLATELIDEIDTQNVLIAVDQAFISGVVGLVAGRLKETYYRPSIVLHAGPDESHGSCRSIPEFHITKALDQLADLLERYGGHAAAAGLTIKNENLPAFVDRLSAIVEKDLDGLDLRPTLQIDSELDIAQVDWALFEVLQQLEPTGSENPTPTFVSYDVEVVDWRVVGRDQSHLQLEFSTGQGSSVRAIAFRMGHWARHMPPAVDIAYSISRNEWKGRQYLQLSIQDMKRRN